MKTSSFLGALAFALAAPLAAFAQYGQPATKVYRVGVLSPIGPNPALEALRQGLKELGYVEGQNLVLETRFAENKLERLPELAQELVKANVDVLVSGATGSVIALQNATTSVPIVFAGLSDPVAAGVLRKLSEPNGNTTGVLLGQGGPAYSAKWIELLREASPGVNHIAVLIVPGSAVLPGFVRELQTAARASSVKLELMDAGDSASMDAAFAAISASGVQAIIVTPDPFFNSNRARIAQFAASKRLPSVSFASVLADAGGLMSYGGNLEASNRRAARHIDRLLKGAKPGDLPIEAMPVELVINRKAAGEMGLTLPPSMLQRADRVID